MMRRRPFLTTSAGAGAALAAATAPPETPDAGVTVSWLAGEPPAVACGVSWGVPLPRGAMNKDQTFRLSAAGGQTLPLQTWPLAYWPDGSLK
jgi:hypothetical protein